MDKIVDLKDRIENEKQRRLLEQYRSKIETIQKMTQCTSCRFRCAMCGQHLTDADIFPHPKSLEYGYAFCDICGEEFEDFRSASVANDQEKPFWHNKEWKEMWSAWSHYQKAMANFIQSSEYKMLMEEDRSGD